MQVIVFTDKNGIVYGTLVEISGDNRAVKLVNAIDLSNCFKEILPEPHDPSSLAALGPNMPTKHSKLPRVLPSITLFHAGAIVECAEPAVVKFATLER